MIDIILVNIHQFACLSQVSNSVLNVDEQKKLSFFNSIYCLFNKSCLKKTYILLYSSNLSCESY